jgi:hypothetical protein
MRRQAASTARATRTGGNLASFSAGARTPLDPPGGPTAGRYFLVASGLPMVGDRALTG